ncbi:DUF4856 domain-containing protein [Alteromonas sp. ASW11-130]|uniref:DUF4856 domain-containing protein n=1 Tax=Alteromonas sp. ASW11-130 TaxID=3015775 RepID=UPI00224195F0|nr:DUF4856 domain-containing protein [Alteromonas sp. ASW11-130]MCW8092974.1 DUF4856 domain-containing protein [Alteromonas sp. ASW11-130]
MPNKTLLTLSISSLFLLSACGGSSNDDSTTPPPPENSAPTDISLSVSAVDENSKGATIGTLSATDADSSDTFTYSTESDKFSINGDVLLLAEGVALDYEQDTSVGVDITVTDSAGATFSKTLTIEVNDLLDYYGFESAFVNGESAVSYSGQTARHLLINDLTILIDKKLGDTNTFDADMPFVNRDAVISSLNSYFDVSDYAALSERDLLTTTDPKAKQQTLAEVSSSDKNLTGKIAGNDPVGQHKDWSTEFAGWGAVGSTTPEGLVRTFFNELADNAQTQLDGAVRQDPFGNDITKIYLTNDGRDLKQLIQKFLLMSVAYSQGTDDYLDNDVAGKGLLSDHTNADGNFTDLEHQFDEGFGYFGAARDYLAYTDEEIAKKGGREGWQGYHDTDNDGVIDFKSEFNFGQSSNAAKRDLGATTAVDLSAEAMNAFLEGRKLLNETAGTELTEEQRAQLLTHRNTAVEAWEKSIAATVVHYINDTTTDLKAIGSDDFSYSDLAKHWSEMKGFALGLQFNPRSKVSNADFIKLHDLMGDAPVLSGAAEVNAYITALAQARDILQNAYSFSDDDVANW